MKVFQIGMNPDRYQYFYPVAELGMPIADINMPVTEGGGLPPMYIPEPRLRATDFYNFFETYLITSPRATNALHEHLERAGPMQPLSYRRQIFTRTDITRYLDDVVDQERVAFHVGRISGVRLGIERYAFHADRFPPYTSLFKLHFDFRSTTYVLEGCGGFRQEFREIIESEGLTGLEFHEVWNNDQVPEFCGSPWSFADYAMDPEDRAMHERWEKGDAEKRREEGQ